MEQPSRYSRNLARRRSRGLSVGTAWRATGQSPPLILYDYDHSRNQAVPRRCGQATRATSKPMATRATTPLWPAGRSPTLAAKRVIPTCTLYGAHPVDCSKEPPNRNLIFTIKPLIYRKASRSVLVFQEVVRTGKVTARCQKASSASRFAFRFVLMYRSTRRRDTRMLEIVADHRNIVTCLEQRDRATVVTLRARNRASRSLFRPRFALHGAPRLASFTSLWHIIALTQCPDSVDNFTVCQDPDFQYDLRQNGLGASAETSLAALAATGTQCLDQSFGICLTWPLRLI